MARRTISIIFIGLFSTVSSLAQTLPDDELQVKLNGYFDNFRVNIVYPTLSFTKSVSPTTSINARYLVDVMSAASMKSHFNVDGVSSATSREAGGGGLVDETRHQIGSGITQLLSGVTLGVNGIYSTESDYTSTTLATQISMPFAKNNTIIQAGFVRSWDKVFPDHRTWTKNLDVTSFSGGLTQVLSKKLILQLDGTYIRNRGFQSDAYTVVSIIGDSTISTFEPVHPDTRDRKAIGVRANYKLGDRAVLKVGYRYYTDDWDVRSHTVNFRVDRRHSSGLVLGTGLRLYSQSNAFFFESAYTAPQVFMTVDSKLDQSYSAEVEIDATWGGQSLKSVPLLKLFFNERVEMTTSFNFYMRHTDSANWHSRYRTLYAYIFGIGYRYRLN